MNNNRLKKIRTLFITGIFCLITALIVYAQDGHESDLILAQQDITDSTGFIFGPQGGSRGDRNYDRRYDNGKYDDRGYDDRRYDNRRYDSRDYDDRRYDSRGYDDRGYDNRKYDRQRYDKRKYDRKRYREKKYSTPPTKYQKKDQKRGYSNATPDRKYKRTPRYDERYGSPGKDLTLPSRSTNMRSVGPAGVGGDRPGYGDRDGQGQWRFYPGKDRGWSKDGGRTFQRENPYERPKRETAETERKTRTSERYIPSGERRGKIDKDDLCRNPTCFEKGTGRPYVMLMGAPCESQNYVLRMYCD